MQRTRALVVLRPLHFFITLLLGFFGKYQVEKENHLLLLILVLRLFISGMCATIYIFLIGTL